MAFLTVHNNPQETFKLGNLFSIGSNPSCDLPRSDETVAERHCRLEKTEDGYLLRDLRSGRLTRLNGQPVTDAILADGDQIEIGKHIFVFLNNEPVETNLGLKSRNPRWASTIKILGSVAPTDHPVLILGPSGSGKEVISQALHQHSTRFEGPFMGVNCSALTETLIESELFGHVKGAFTGAIADRKGAFEAARGGTLFLDEIGDLPYGLQAKLLRALENNEIRPVGSDRVVKTNVRVISATHQNLLEKIAAKEFRADLYFRLNVVTVHVPSLQERMEDFEEILINFARALKVRFSLGAIAKLKQHTWPGNVRELRNTVTRASAFFPRQTITESHLDMIIDNLTALPGYTHALPTAEDQIPAKQLPIIREIEKQMIIKRLIANQGNQRVTASELGMPKSTLHDRLKQYNLNPKDYNSKALQESRVLERLSL